MVSVGVFQGEVRSRCEYIGRLWEIKRLLGGKNKRVFPQLKQVRGDDEAAELIVICGCDNGCPISSPGRDCSALVFPFLLLRETHHCAPLYIEGDLDTSAWTASVVSSLVEPESLSLDFRGLGLIGCGPSAAGIAWPCVLKATKFTCDATAGILPDRLLCGCSPAGPRLAAPALGHSIPSMICSTD